MTFALLKRKQYVALLLVGMLLCSISSLAQKKNRNAGPEKDYKNVVRFNLSNFLLFGAGNIILGYERVVTPSQSFSVNFGLASLPDLTSINTDSLQIDKESSKTGFNISADYRFYLAKENKYHAPRGVYIGPYVSYNAIHKETNWEFNRNNTKSYATVDTDFTIIGAGIELGYQFIFWNRMTLDLVLIGPGLAKYNFNAKIDGNIDLSERTELLQVLQQALENKYPGMSVVLEDKEIDANGRLGVTSVGFRYLIHVGFRF